MSKLFKLFISVSIFATVCLSACNNGRVKTSKDISVNSTQLTKITSNKTIHDFGSIKQGEILAYSFYIENVGDSNLVINKIESSCGCTVVKWEKKPLLPKRKMKIEVEFNSSGRYGKQYKVISIFANVPNKVYELIITAEVN